MSYHTVDIAIDSFEPDEDGCFRARHADFKRPVTVGDVVSVCDDELLEFARVERTEGDPGAGSACLKVLTDSEGEQAARARALDPTGAQRSSPQSSRAAPADLLRYFCGIWSRQARPPK